MRTRRSKLNEESPSEEGGDDKQSASSKSDASGEVDEKVDETPMQVSTNKASEVDEGNDSSSEPPPNDSDDDDVVEEASTAKESNVTAMKERRKQKKEAIKKKKEEQRSRNAGFLKENEQGTVQNKKIRFRDDDETYEYQDYKEEEVKEEGKNDTVPEMNDNSDSDDEVEQVTTSKAKQEALELRAAERKIRVEESLLNKRKKRKSKLQKAVDVTTIDEDEDDVDEDFFAQVDKLRDDKVRQIKKQKMFDKVREDYENYENQKAIDALFEKHRPLSENLAQAKRNNIELKVLDDDSSIDEDDIITQRCRREKQSVISSSYLGKSPTKDTLAFRKQRRNRYAAHRSRKMKYPTVKRNNVGRPCPNFLVKR